MSKYDWAWRSVCSDCKSVDNFEHFDSSDFWVGRDPCPKCGGVIINKKCRAVKKRWAKFTWWNPLTWFAYKIEMQFKL